MMNNTPSGAKMHRESTKPELHQTARMFFLSSFSSSFAILSSLHKDYFGVAIPSLDLELAVCNENIPKGVTR